MKLLHFGKNNPQFKYFMHGREFQCIVVEKDWGVFVDKDLKSERQINEIVKKADKIAGMITHYIQY